MASMVARAYNRGLGAEPSAGYRGTAHSGSGGKAPGEQSPAEAETLLIFGCSMETAKLLAFLNWEKQKKFKNLSSFFIFC